MRLYHYTSTNRAASIIWSQRIKPSESNIGAPWESPAHPYGRHAAPPVVHLVDTPTPTPGGHNVTGAPLHKQAARLSVELPRPIRWMEWEFVTLMDPDWRAMVVDRAGGEQAVERWYVAPATLRPHLWVAIDARPFQNTALELGPTPDEYGYHEVLAPRQVPTGPTISQIAQAKGL